MKYSLCQVLIDISFEWSCKTLKCPDLGGWIQKAQLREEGTGYGPYTLLKSE